jgi:hypothetical protein
LSPESLVIVEADAVSVAEGNSEELETQGSQPGVLSASPPPGS